MTFLIAEMRDVDSGKGIGCFDQQLGTALHRPKLLACLQDRQRTFEAS
jgi:hypothetical protein